MATPTPPPLDRLDDLALSDRLAASARYVIDCGAAVVETPETIFTPDGWRVVAHGVGTYGSARERSQVTIYSTENM